MLFTENLAHKFSVAKGIMFMYRHNKSFAENVSQYFYPPLNLPVKNVVQLNAILELNNTN